MYFHKIIRIEKDENLKDRVSQILDNNKFIIVPFINPYSEAGKFLLDKNESAVLSEYSGKLVDILYLHTDSADKYENFVESIFSQIQNIMKSKIRDPSIIVFWPNAEKMLWIGVDDAKVEKVKILLFQIIDALDSDTDRQLKFLKTMTKTKQKLSENSKTVFEILRTIFQFFM